MRLFSEPTYRERLADFAEDVTDRIGDAYYGVTERLPDLTDADFARGLGWAGRGGWSGGRGRARSAERRRGRRPRPARTSARPVR